MIQTDKIFKRSDRRVIAYYIFLMIGLLLLTRPQAHYNELFRLLFIALIYMPLFSRPQYTPFVVLFFYGFCEFACYSILPETEWICLIPLLAIFVKNRNTLFNDLLINNRIYVLLYTYCLVISLVSFDLDQRFLYYAFFSMILSSFIQDESDIRNMALGFCFMSAALAINYIMNYSFYISTSGYLIGGYEYGTWGNRNVLSGAIATGIPIASGILFKNTNFELSKTLRYIVIVCAVLSFSALITLASRGAIVASAISVLSLLLLSNNINLKKKILVIAIIVGVIAVFYAAGKFNVLLYRFLESGTTETAGGRTDIWSFKLNAWSDCNIVEQIFGLGKTGNSNIGNFFRSTHNDFLTSLIAFGIIGFLLFISFIIHPFFKASRDKRRFVLPVLLFIIAECMVLEPFFRGYVAFWSLYVFLIKYISITSQYESQ